MAANAAVQSLPTLTTPEQVHNLTYEESQRGFPVHFRQVQVLYYNAALGNLFVFGSGHGIFVRMQGLPAIPAHAGDFLEIEGVANPGGYAAVVAHPQIRVTGKGALPQAPVYSLDHLLTGIEDCQWVAVEGVVRSFEIPKQTTSYSNQAASGDTNVLITLATGAGRLDVIVGESGGFDYARLVDARVRVQGVSAPRFNQNRQLIGIHLDAENFEQFHVLERGPEDPFALPIRALDSVLQYTPGVEPDHRIRVRGVVTANWDGRFLAIADAGHGLFVGAPMARDLKVGDVVDVAGFPALGDYSPILEDVIYRKVGTGALPPPIALSISEMFKGVADAEQVRIRGRLLKQTRTLQEVTLLISAEDRTFTAVLPLSPSSELPANLRDGSILDLTGTCYVEVFPNRTPRAVQILLRTPRDIVVVQPAPWWTAADWLAALGTLLAAVLVALAWIARLRRHVRMQTIALEKAREEAAAIDDLARAMQEVTAQRKLTARVSAAGSEQIAQLGVGFNRMLSELEEGEMATRKAEAKLQRQALTDELTGLPNRRALSEQLARSLAVAEGDGSTAALLFIDLDGFKTVNDSLGHAVGDLLLIEVAQRLQSRIRKGDTLARLGGDEFTVLLTSLRERRDAEVVAGTLLEVLSEQFVFGGHEIVIGASIGISLFPQDGTDPTALLQQADSAMYAAKGNGKNQVRCFTAELGFSLRERLSLESQLRGAVARGEIHLQYQPEFDLLSHRLTRFEALARWTHPVLGKIPPGKFIPVAEDSGQIIALGAFVLRQACLEALKWQAIAPYPVHVAVNVSSLQFTRATFVEEVAQTLEETGLKPGLLQIELTESIMLTGADRAAATMTRLRSLGISLAIDDFGTGYSCLSYLPRLPFDTLKIDRSFVHELATRPGAKDIVSFLIALAHSLHMQVVVEGVETVEQLEIIKVLNGNEVQGFLMGRPMTNPQSLLGKDGDLMKFNVDLTGETV